MTCRVERIFNWKQVHHISYLKSVIFSLFCLNCKMHLE